MFKSPGDVNSQLGKGCGKHIAPKHSEEDGHSGHMWQPLFAVCKTTSAVKVRHVGQGQ